MVRHWLFEALLSVVFCAIALHAGPGAAATKVLTAGLQYQIDKTPAWVKKVAGPDSVLPSAAAGGSTQVLLSDTQVSLLGAKPASYFHFKTTALERSGLERISTIRIGFNPRFETLTFHELAVIRDGKRIDRLKSARIDLAQRERRLEEGIYDEEVEAIVAVTDIRVGDFVEYAYTIAGENPVFAGRYSSFFPLNREHPIARLSIRIQYPASRSLATKVHGSELTAAESTERSVRTLTLAGEALQPVRPEQAVPAWFMMFPWLEVTEYRSWEEVNAWARNLYATPVDLSPEIVEVLTKFKAEAKSERELAGLTLSWVQNEIRYYSVSVGTSSHRPNHPNLTVRQRFGDCKDKSLLLSAMLKWLGIKAEPALVSFRLRKGVVNAIPTPHVFDHVIVRAELPEGTYWLDGTRTHQGRGLENLGFTQYGHALPTETQANDLVAVAAPPAAREGFEVVETFKVIQYGSPAALTTKERYFGILAEMVRQQIAARGIARFIEVQQTDYAKDFPNITVSGEAAVTDDVIANELTIIQTFGIPRLFKYDAGRARMAAAYARSFVNLLRFPGAGDRKFPLALPYPGRFDHRIVLELPNRPAISAPPPESWQDGHLALSNRWTVAENRITADYGLRAQEDSVAVANIRSFSDKFKQGSAMLFSSISLPLIDNARLRPRLARDFERSGINFRKPDQADNYHQKFLRDFAIADESVRSGLISGSVLAQALKDRAVAGSSLGRRQEALEDVTKAIDLDAAIEAHVLKAEILLYSGLYQEASDTLALSTRDEQGQSRAQMVAGMANYYLGRFEEARRSFAQAAETVSAEELPYSLIWLSVAARKSGADPDALVKKHRARLSGSWPSDAVTYMLGGLDEERLIALARQDEKESRLRLCEAYFYLGQKALLDGNHADARRWFDKSVDTKVIMYREHMFSQHELKRLEGR